MKTIKNILPALLVVILLACNNNSTEAKDKTDSAPVNTSVYDSAGEKKDTASYEKMVNKTNDSTP